MNKVINYLDKLYPNPKPQLNSNNSFEFLIAVVLSAQCTDAKVNKVIKVLFEKYDINSLAFAKISDLEQILKPLGMYRKKSIYIKNIANKIIDNNYIIPNNMKDLIKLDGVGRKVANVVMAQLYNKSCMPVDTHILRISKRLGIANDKDNAYIVEKKLVTVFSESKLNKLHLQLISFGRQICTARKPKCSECELKDICIYEKKS